jgi:hypothetical protein
VPPRFRTASVPHSVSHLLAIGTLRRGRCLPSVRIGRRKKPLHKPDLLSIVSSCERVDRGSYAEENPMCSVVRALGRRVLSTMALPLLSFGVVACASSSGASPDIATSANPPAVPTSRASAPSTSTPSTSAPSTSASSTSSLPSATETTSSTSTTKSAPEASTENSIRAAVALAQQTFSDCLVAMPKCDPAILSVARAGPLLERNVARINEWNAAGYTVRNRDEFRFVVESVALKPDGLSASAMVCIADGSALVHPGAGPAGADVIVDDSYTSGRSAWDMRLDPDGKWRVYDAPAVGPTESSDVCPAG